MSTYTQAIFENLKSEDRGIQTEAFYEVQRLSNEKVDWAYEIWDELRSDLSHPDNHRRSIAAQLLCNLAKSDPEGRVLGDMPALFELTKDKRFVTARHCLQALWKIGLAGKEQKEQLLLCLTARFRDCVEEKNWTLIRYDIIQGLRNLYDQEPDPSVKQLALDLIETEEDLKYRKKYATVWKK
jgi:hypothetical protein